MKTVTSIPNDPRYSGCIVLEQGTGFLSKQIILHMKLWAKMKKKEPLPFSHAEFLIYYEGHLHTAGAREKGLEISRVEDYYTHGHNLLVLFPVIPLNYRENDYMRIFLWSIDDHKYQYTNFLSWIHYIKTFGRQWIGERGDKNLYCYELAARCANRMNRWPKGKSLDIVSIYDLVENNYYTTAPKFLNHG